MILPKVQNYHKHSDDTNVIVTDSPTTYEEYAKRIKEVGGTILSSVAHGWQGRYHYCYEVAKKNNLKFIFGSEVYWVKNRKDKDNTNCHMIILARNKQGMEEINYILSIANTDGYYFKARVDLELLLSLNPNNVFITTACIGGWKYEDSEEIFVKLHKHFKENFMLEIQMHNTPEQKILNKKILDMSYKYGINIILGIDSHYIYPEQKRDRDDLLQSKHIKYHDEESDWYMDYPDNETIFNRLKEQGVLNDNEIIKAMQNTNIILDFDDIEFNKEMKLPTIYPDLTQEEKDKKFKDIINEEFKKFIIKNKINKEKIKDYKEAIQQEASVILNTHMADYFLLNYEIIKRGKELGGVMTPSGRGSSGGFLLNTLFGFSSMDRLNAPILLYPERFLTEDRVKAGSLVDIDFNVSNAEPFIQAQKEIIGDTHAYPMIAFGKIKAKSGFKMYARAKNLDFEIANEISKQIAQYEKAYMTSNEEQKEFISIYNYVDKEYHSYIKNSEVYLGILVDKKIAPCSHILYTEKDLRREIGVMRLTNKVTGKDVLVACIEGHIADRFGYLKNDILTVSVLEIISTTYKKINKPMHTVTELTEITKDDKKTWEIYEKGLTCCINQCESVSTTQKVRKYKPKNITELSGFIAAIRPGFKSMYQIFEERKPFEYGIKIFDNLIQTKEMPYSFILYQEQLMQTFAFIGYPISQCYTIIKAVAKKKPDVLIKLKDEFKEKCIKKLMEIENIDEKQAEKYTENIWKIAEDSSNYSFNASHSLAYAYDSLYCSYLKANYPFEFYETILEFYSNKGEKDRVKSIIQEMKYFGISLGKFEYLSDNRAFVADKENNKINPSLISLKGIGKNTPEELYSLPKINNFIDLLVYINENTQIKKSELKTLIYINYFHTFGTTKKLIMGYEIFFEKVKYDKKNSIATKTKKINQIKDEFYSIPSNVNFSKMDRLIKELEILGESNISFKNANNDFIVLDIDNKYNTYKIELMNLKTNEILTFKINKFDYEKLPFYKFNILSSLESYDDYIRKYRILSCEKHFTE